MQHFMSSRRRHPAGDGATSVSVSVSSTGAARLAQAYREQGFRVDQIAPTANGLGDTPDAALLLHRGLDSVLVHAYCRGHAPLTPQAVHHLAEGLFEACATSAVLVGRAGFTPAARNAAIRLGQIGLLDGAALQAMTGGSEAEAWESLSGPEAMPIVMLDRPRRPAWPVRAAIGAGGLALAATMVFASLPVLRDAVHELLTRPAVATTADLPQAPAEPWLAPAQSRSGDLALKAAPESAPRVHQAAFETTDGLPANFNQALSAPRL
jgi:hypothetical protein